MPKVRRRLSMRRASWVDSQALRRASSGWRETGAGDSADKVFGPMPWRSVSWTPGADGADVLVDLKVLVWAEGGTMRMDCEEGCG